MGQSASKHSTFTSFANLPREIRLLIWELALPRYRDLRLGRPCNIRPFRQGDQRLASTSMEAPVGLLGACRESRGVALAHGTYKRYERAIRGRMQWNARVWIDHDIRTLHMSLKIPDLKVLYYIPANIQAVAELWPDYNSVFRIGHWLKRHRQTTGMSTIETVYFGLSAIPLKYCQGGNVTRPPYMDSDSAVVALDDERLPEYLESAFRVARSRSSNRLTYHRSAECYLAHLNRWWKESTRAALLRRKWELQGVPGLEVKPAIMFGKTDRLPGSALLKQMMYFVPQKDGLEFELGLAGGKLSRYAVKPSFDCETVCSSAETPEFIRPQAWEQMNFFKKY